jgi:hypothetical protein
MSKRTTFILTFLIAAAAATAVFVLSPNAEPCGDIFNKPDIVERTIAWLNRCRRLAKDWECLNRKALAFLRLASIRLMLRKLCQQRA